MTRDADQNAPTACADEPITPHVDLNSQGGWEVALPDQRELITTGCFTASSSTVTSTLTGARGHR